MKHEIRIQGVEDSRIQVKGVEVKPLEPSNPASVITGRGLDPFPDLFRSK
jgi:hypothetical protein